jgi:hypothetical protein
VRKMNRPDAEASLPYDRLARASGRVSVLVR